MVRGDDQRQGQFSVVPVDKTLERKFYKVIKIVHHLQKVSGTSEPRAIARMIEVLSSMIRPAFPIPATEDFIRGNALNWGYNTVTILQTHYTEALEDAMEDLSLSLVPVWRPAFESAVRWVRKELPHLVQETVDHVEALISVAEVGGVQQPLPPLLPTPPPPSTPLLPPPSTPLQPSISPPSPRTEPLQLGDADHGKPQSDSEVFGDVVQPEEPEAFVARSPQPQRTRRSLRGCVIPENSVLMEIDMSEVSSEQLQGRPDPAHSSDLGVDTESTGEGHQEIEAQVHTQGDSRGESSGLDMSRVVTSTPLGRSYRVHQHIRTDRKMIDWDLVIEKKWLILGDSNLSRFPDFSDPDLQVDSYPGANFRHAQALMEKARCRVLVEKLVLSFGLNCRDQKVKETSIKQMQAALRTARRRFPDAAIWIPVINFSAHLPLKEKETLRLLNTHIEHNMPKIPPLSGCDFFTGKDHIHWTKETAKVMLAHWLRFLGIPTQ